MDRRQYLAVLAGMLSVAGCTGMQDETITMLAVNQDDTSHVALLKSYCSDIRSCETAGR